MWKAVDPHESRPVVQMSDMISAMCAASLAHLERPLIWMMLMHMSVNQKHHHHSPPPICVMF